MRSVGAFEAKTHLAALLDAVGAGEQITITRHGRPVARLVPPDDTPPVDLGRTIQALQRFSQGQTLEGLSVQELRDAGRR
jgi:prevent-host-death family protein